VVSVKGWLIEREEESEVSKGKWEEEGQAINHSKCRTYL